MTNGDAAAAVGMDVVAGTSDLRKGYDEDNKTRDYLAAHQTSGTHPASAITTGTLDLARLPFPYQPVKNGGAAGMTTQTVWLGWNGSNRVVVAVDGAVVGNLAFDSGSSGTWTGPVNTAGGDVYTGGGRLITPGGRNFTVSSAWVAAGIDGSGALGIQPSARRFKKYIKEADTSRLDAFLAMRDVEYELIAAIEGAPRSPKQIGWIAEELAEAGYTELVAYDTDLDSEHYGEPISINYAQAVVPLHQLVSRQATELAELRATVAELAARLNTIEEN